MRSIEGLHRGGAPHWVGDGFPVRTLFDYENLGRGRLSPFLMLDHAAPKHFEPAEKRRGVGPHPHRGFETVTIVYQGELEHRDSAGNGGRIGPGDVQWMTAGSGLLHEEFHSDRFTREGGVMEMMQLWVNLPARHKAAAPGYQTLLDSEIPSVTLPQGAGTVRVIAGEFGGETGPARTFTPVDVWDLKVRAGRTAELAMPDGHTAAAVLMHGRARANGQEAFGEGQLVLFSRLGDAFSIEAETDATLLVLGGRPIDEPVVGYGPFVMNTKAEIHQAIRDFQAGVFGTL